ncbi:biotin synthase BioB [Telmatospirillum siberiense]|uniref:Biotin synthase n=1 Tax=Telmatospirillum siberiense TaxID=382514 RepID=A0A2N3PTT1_9PROT|nr:biotin synthase BioB [Telmatospirillum siberiense]PKU23796.1 biotin synthase BioB [Telmatospirillum siberiense]
MHLSNKTPNATGEAPATAADGLRHDWSLEEIEALFALAFNDLLYRAMTVHREHFDPNRIQISRLLSIKTGKCPEDCKYCPQSAHYDTGVEKEDLMEVEAVLTAARAAKESGASRFCMGAAWKSPGKDFDVVLRMVEGVKALGLETCATLGMLNAKQAEQLKEAGLDYYNHNIDTSPEHYSKIITTRTFDDRLDTLEHVREAGLKVCCGGIVGMGEQQDDRARMLQTLVNMPRHPESVPINLLIKAPGTPLENVADVDPFDFVRTIAVARILMPQSHVRLSAGRQEMSDETQALCFLAGANSVFCGERLLTTQNPSPHTDKSLFGRLGLKPEGV